MTDGPHKSLPLKPKWKKVAEAAWNENCDLDQVAELMVEAILGEFDRDILLQTEGCLNPQNSLFIDDLDQVITSLEAIRIQCSGAPVSAIFDIAIDNVIGGQSGDAAMFSSGRALLEDSLPKYGRSIEDHYMRKKGSSSAAMMRDRYTTAMSRIDMDSLTRRLVSGSSQRLPLSTSTNRTDIDAGVRF